MTDVLPVVAFFAVPLVAALLCRLVESWEPRRWEEVGRS